MKSQLKVSKTEEIQNSKKTWLEPELNNLSIESGMITLSPETTGGTTS